MMVSNKVRAIDTAHNTKVLSLMGEGQQYKTFCFAAQGWAVVTRTAAGFLVKAPKARKAQPMTMAQAVDAIIVASHGA